MTIQNNSDELLTYLIAQVNTGAKNWFGFQQQKIAGIYLAYRMAEAHGTNMKPEDIAEYVHKLNNAIYKRIIKEE
jgi:hypothetical protein